MTRKKTPIFLRSLGQRSRSLQPLFVKFRSNGLWLITAKWFGLESSNLMWWLVMTWKWPLLFFRSKGQRSRSLAAFFSQKGNGTGTCTIGNFSNHKIFKFGNKTLAKSQILGILSKVSNLSSGAKVWLTKHLKL